MLEVLSALEELDDVQNIFTNAILENLNYENCWYRSWFKWSNSYFKR